MKQSLVYTFLFVALALAFSACEKQNVVAPENAVISDNAITTDNHGQPSNVDNTKGKGNHIMIAANPAITFIRSNTPIGNKTVPNTIYVMDATGQNATMIYNPWTISGHSVTGNAIRYPKWSGNGDNICFIKDSTFNLNGVQTLSRNLFTLNISVVNGVPKASNVTKILDGSANQGQYRQAAWAPTASEIAVLWYHLLPGNTSDPAMIQVVPSGGGTPTTIYTCQSLDFAIAQGSICYSEDGSKIAFRESQVSTSQRWIKVIDHSTGALLKSVEVSQFYALNNFDWSRTSGSTTITFDAMLTSTSQSLMYTIDVYATSPTPNQVWNIQSASEPTWSPDDTKLAYHQNGIKTINIANGTITTLTSNSGVPYIDGTPNWKH